jgi:hypothetical protein
MNYEEVVIGGADKGLEMAVSTSAEAWSYNQCRFFPELFLLIMLNIDVTRNVG